MADSEEQKKYKNKSYQGQDFVSKAWNSTKEKWGDYKEKQQAKTSFGYERLQDDEKKKK